MTQDCPKNSKVVNGGLNGGCNNLVSKDRAGHDRSANGFEWKADLDTHGKRMEGKHKGETGKFFPKKEFSVSGGGK